MNTQLWEEKQIINGGYRDSLSSVDIDGNTMVIGAPRALGYNLRERIDIYNYDGNNWIRVQNISAPIGDTAFGNSVSTDFRHFLAFSSIILYSPMIFIYKEAESGG